MRLDTRPHNAKSPTAEQFAALVGQLRRANEELNDFVRALAHDMGANLMLMESSTARLKRALADDRRAGAEENLDHLEACLRQSRRLLDDMVELGRSGSVRVEPCRVELEAVVDEVLFEQRELLSARGVEVRVERPLPAFWCNEDRLKQIVVNLVCNAVKHGCNPQGGRVTISGAEETGKLAGFRVHDNGPGIDPRWHEEVFLPGRRLPGTTTEGSGMGLAIVRKIAGLYRGDVRVDPHVSAGTAFVVRLPKAEQTASRPASRRAGGPSDPPPARHAGHSPRPHDPRLERPGRR